MGRGGGRGVHLLAELAPGLVKPDEALLEVLHEDAVGAMPVLEARSQSGKLSPKALHPVLRSLICGIIANLVLHPDLPCLNLLLGRMTLDFSEAN